MPQRNAPKPPKLERGIPIPDVRPGYASMLRALKVGESYRFPPSHKSSTVRKRAAHALGMGNYKVRQVRKKGRFVGTRVWRTK